MTLVGCEKSGGHRRGLCSLSFEASHTASLSVRLDAPSNLCNFQAGVSYDDGSCSISVSLCNRFGGQNFNPNAIVDVGPAVICVDSLMASKKKTQSNALEPGLLLTEASLPLGVDTSAYNLLVVPPNYTNRAQRFQFLGTLSDVSGLPLTCVG